MKTTIRHQSLLLLRKGHKPARVTRNRLTGTGLPPALQRARSDFWIGRRGVT